VTSLEFSNLHSLLECARVADSSGNVVDGYQLPQTATAPVQGDSATQSGVDAVNSQDSNTATVRSATGADAHMRCIAFVALPQMS
jgi:hypothetical protein